MERKKSFQPGDLVKTLTGQRGMVLSLDTFELIRNTLKEGKRPGRFFAPGCCQYPDYMIQVPVLFEDETFDVMRSMNIKREQEFSEELRERIQSIIDRHAG